MKKLKSITVAVTDPLRPRQLAAKKAAAIAAKCGARLTLLNTFMLPQPMPEPPMDDSRRILEAAIRLRMQSLRSLAAKLGRKAGLKIRCEVRWDFPPHAAIVRHVLEKKPDLLVAESHRHSRLLRLVLANTDWELIRNCPCPLWFVRSEKLPRKLKMLVAVDPAHTRAKPARLDDYLLQTAKTVAHGLGGTVDIAHAYLQPHNIVFSPMDGAVTVPLAPEELRAHVARIKKSVDKIAEKYSIASGSRHINAGIPHEMLVQLSAKLKASVLVMGAISRGAIDRLFIGSTAERVIDHVDCDVLVVKPAGFRTAIARRRPAFPSR
jgi:universal stress protein E